CTLKTTLWPTSCVVKGRRVEGAKWGTKDEVFLQASERDKLINKHDKS
ncbi:5749_t:CDS:1, partial [Racocetra persica]